MSQSTSSIAQENGFWPALTLLVAKLSVTRPLYYALRYVLPIVDTPVPAHVLREAEVGRRLRSAGLTDALFVRTLKAPCAGKADRLAALARGSLYLRAHWLRMPPLPLARHLTVKALGRGDENVA